MKLAPPSSLPLVLLPKFIFVDGTQTLQGNNLNFFRIRELFTDIDNISHSLAAEKH